MAGRCSGGACGVSETNLQAGERQTQRTQVQEDLAENPEQAPRQKRRQVRRTRRKSRGRRQKLAERNGPMFQKTREVQQASAVPAAGGVQNAEAGIRGGTQQAAGNLRW